jgi:xanthine dehydrogenase accessory factor
MTWLSALHIHHTTHTACVLVTLIAVRGHAPREAGAKMLVTADSSFDTIGGGNLEACAIEMARAMITQHKNTPERHTLRLNHEQSLYGVQCCGGEVELLLEPMLPKPSIAIFGLGHVGYALAKILCLLPVRLFLVDSRAEMLTPERLEPLDNNPASLESRFTPVMDGIVPDLPTQTHVLVMTHDHAEDLYILKAALKRPDFSSLGVIGSQTKWQRFRRKLLEAGFAETDLERIDCPIGLPQIQSKAPAAIAIGVAARLLEQGRILAGSREDAVLETIVK